MSYYDYGTMDVSKCPLCYRQALSKNKAGVTVCQEHADFEFPEMKCACRESLEVKEGKFGAFCVCYKCGTINLRKALEINNINLAQFKMEKKEILVDASNAHLFGLR